MAEGMPAMGLFPLKSQLQCRVSCVVEAYMHVYVCTVTRQQVKSTDYSVRKASRLVQKNLNRLPETHK